MKKVILSIVLLFAFIFTSCKNEIKKEKTTTTEVAKEMAMKNISFGVRGNCGMCKITIEKAANSLEGVTNAMWDVDKKSILVSFNSGKTDELKIHNVIAASGYDTEKVMGNLEAFNNLPGCCQYDHDMLMNQLAEVK